MLFWWCQEKIDEKVKSQCIAVIFFCGSCQCNWTRVRDCQRESLPSSRTIGFRQTGSPSRFRFVHLCPPLQQPRVFLCKLDFQLPNLWFLPCTARFFRVVHVVSRNRSFLLPETIQQNAILVVHYSCTSEELTKVYFTVSHKLHLLNLTLLLKIISKC